MKMEGYEGVFLSPEDIVKLHDQIIDDSDLNDDKGFIDITGDLFNGAVYGVFAGFGGYSRYPSIEEKAAALCFNIISSHVFRNANKRTGLMTMLMTLRMNGKNASFDHEELFNIINGVGSGTKSYEDLLYFIAPSFKNQYGL